MKLAVTRFATRLGEMFLATGPRDEVAYLSFLGMDGGAAEREARGRKALLRAGHDLRDRPSAGGAIAAQVEEYLDGDRQEFDCELAPDGTAFQRSVWDELVRIRFGSTASYRDVAERIGNPRAVRAVARANATNPISLIVPCHRVIGSDGTLTGFGGGLDVKRALLELEGAGVGRA